MTVVVIVVVVRTAAAIAVLFITIFLNDIYFVFVVDPDPATDKTLRVHLTPSVARAHSRSATFANESQEPW